MRGIAEHIKPFHDVASGRFRGGIENARFN
jgi:hypothetical protein